MKGPFDILDEKLVEIRKVLAQNLDMIGNHETQIHELKMINIELESDKRKYEKALDCLKRVEELKL